MARDYGSLSRPLEQVTSDPGHSTSKEPSAKTKTVLSRFKGLVKVMTKFSIPQIDQFGNIPVGGSNIDQFGNISFSGRSKRKSKNKDPLFLNNKKDNVQSLKSNQPFSDCVGQLFTLFKKIDDEERKEEELLKFRRTEELIREEEKHREIIAALEKATKPKKEPSKPEKPKTKPPVREEPPITKALKRTASIAPKVAAGAVAVGAATSVSEAIAGGESGKAGYNAANMGTKGGKIISAKPVNLEDMYISEIMQRQAIKWGSPNESQKLLAVGKYQMIPSTLKEAVAALGINPNTTKFDRATQERMFRDYLITQKKPAIAKYLNSPVDDPKLLHAALKSLSLEWASVADPDIPGGKTSHYGHGNKASVSVDTMAALLKKDREKNMGKTTLATQESPPIPSENVADMSAETRLAKKELQAQAASINMNELVNNIVVQGSTYYQMASKAISDLPAFKEAQQ